MTLMITQLERMSKPYFNLISASTAPPKTLLILCLDLRDFLNLSHYVSARTGSIT